MVLSTHYSIEEVHALYIGYVMCKLIISQQYRSMMLGESSVYEGWMISICQPTNNFLNGAYDAQPISDFARTREPELFLPSIQ